MRFEFCGKLDCPDWILVQLFHASRWSRADFEIVCNSVRETILEGKELNEDELFERLGLYDDQTAAESSLANRLDIDDVRACFGALSFILNGARSYQVNELQLKIELEQLGLASEHSKVLCKHANKNNGLPTESRGSLQAS